MRPKIQFNWIFAIGLICLVVGGLMWVNYQYSQNNPGGNDFLVHYVGTRSLLFEDLSPYSDEVAVRIQTAAYGHPAQGIEHELRVAYPLYSIILFSPFSLIENYELSRALWMTLLEIALIATAILAMNLVDWRPALWIQGAVLLFSVVWYHAVRSVINGNVVILIGLMLTEVFLLIKHNRDQLAGLLLAVTTIKPQLVVLIIPYIVIWAVYQRRWKLIRWFAGSMIALIVFGLLIMPDWMMQNFREVLRYPGYNPAGTLAAAMGEWFPAIGSELKWGLAIILSSVLIMEWWNARKASFRHFLWTGFLTLVISQWIGIQTDPGNFIMLFPIVILIISEISLRWKKQETLITGIVLFGLFFGLWILFITTIQRSYQPVQNPVMFLPVPGLCLLGLYWVKWWMLRSIRTIWNETI